MARYPCRSVNGRLRAAITPLTLAGITLLAGVLRFAFLDSQPLWYDERLQVDVASRATLWNVLLGVVSHSAAAPLDYLGTRLSLIVFDAPRVWPALVGTLTIPLLYLAGRRWYGETVGVVAAVLLAVAPFHVYYSGEARYYALSALVAVLALWTYRIGSDSDRWWPFALATGLCLYSFYFAFLVPLALVAIYRRGLWQLLVGTVAFLPWVLLALPSQLAQSYPQSEGLSTVPTPVLLAQLVAPDFEVSGLPWIVPTLVLGTVGVLLARGGRQAWLTLALVIGAIVVTGLVTWRAGYFWSPRQVLFVLPLLLLVMAVGWSRLPRLVGIALLVALCALWVPFIDGMTGTDAWQPRTVEL